MVFVDTKYDLVKDITTINEYVEDQKRDNPDGYLVKNVVDEAKYFDTNKITSK